MRGVLFNLVAFKKQYGLNFSGNSEKSTTGRKVFKELEDSVANRGLAEPDSTVASLYGAIGFFTNQLSSPMCKTRFLYLDFLSWAEGDDVSTSCCSTLRFLSLFFFFYFFFSSHRESMSRDPSRIICQALSSPLIVWVDCRRRTLRFMTAFRMCFTLVQLRKRKFSRAGWPRNFMQVSSTCWASNIPTTPSRVPSCSCLSLCRFALLILDFLLCRTPHWSAFGQQLWFKKPS